MRGGGGVRSLRCSPPCFWCPHPKAPPTPSLLPLFSLHPDPFTFAFSAPDLTLLSAGAASDDSSDDGGDGFVKINAVWPELEEMKTWLQGVREAAYTVLGKVTNQKALFYGNEAYMGALHDAVLSFLPSLPHFQVSDFTHYFFGLFVRNCPLEAFEAIALPPLGAYIDTMVGALDRGWRDYYDRVEGRVTLLPEEEVQADALLTDLTSAVIDFLFSLVPLYVEQPNSIVARLQIVLADQGAGPSMVQVRGMEGRCDFLPMGGWLWIQRGCACCPWEFVRCGCGSEEGLDAISSLTEDTHTRTHTHTHTHTAVQTLIMGVTYPDTKTRRRAARACARLVPFLSGTREYENLVGDAMLRAGSCRLLKRV